MSKNITISYRVPLTGLKVSTNKIYGGIHWTKRKESADAIHSIAGFFCRPVQKVESYPVEIFYKFVFASRALDTLNCAYMSKCFEDAFRTIGILEDDSPKFVTRSIIESHQRVKVKVPKGVNSQRQKADAKSEDYVEIIINSI